MKKSKMSSAAGTRPALWQQEEKHEMEAQGNNFNWVMK